MAGQYDAGEAFLQILPSMRGFAQRVKNGLRGVRVEFEVPVSFALDRAGLAGLRTALRALPVVLLDADSTPADREIAAVRDRIERLSGRTIGLDISGDAARAELDAIRSDLERLGASAPTIGIRVDAAAAESVIGGVQREVSRLDGRRVNVRVIVDAAQAIASVVSLGFAINQFVNRKYEFRVDADTAGAVFSVLRLVATVGLLGGAAGIVGGLGGALLGLVPAGAAAAAGIGPVVLAFLGVGKALQALSAQQESAATDAQAAAKQQQSAAFAVAGAQDQVRQASTSASRARVEGARSVAEAEKSASRQVDQALRAQATAQRSLRQATSDLEQEQADLTRAWEDGRRSLQDLQSQVRGNSIDQRQAAIDLRDAQRELDEARTSGNAEAIERATVAYDRQAATVEDLRTRGERLAVDNSAAQAKGVAGSDQVVAANDRIAAATVRQGDAVTALSDADTAVVAARTEGADSVARAQEQATQRIADADQQVVAANRALQQALAQTGDAGSASANKVAQAFADLSPEAASFALYLFGLKPLLNELSGVAATAFFPPLRAGMDTLIAQAPAAKTVISQLAGAMGTGLGNVLTTLASPYWQSFFAFLGNVGVTLIPRLFESLMTLAGAGTELIRVLLPLSPAAFAFLDQLSALIVVLAPFIAQLLGGLIPAASAFLAALTPLGPVLAALAPILAVLAESVAVVLAAVLEALAPILVALTPLIQALAVEFAESLVAGIQAATPILLWLAEWLSANPDLVIKVISVIAGLAVAFQPLMWVLGLVVTALARMLIVSAITAALAPFGAAGAMLARVLTYAISPLSLLRAALPFVGQAIGFVGRMILSALGPMGLLIAVFGFLYSSNEEFRTAVNQLLGVLVGLVGTLVTALMPAVMSVVDAIVPLVGIFAQALIPIVNIVAAVLVDLISTVLPPLVAVLTNVVIPIVKVLAEVLAAILVWVITKVVVPALQFMAWLLTNVVGPTIMWLWQNVVKPAFETIGQIISVVWQGVIRPVFDAIVGMLGYVAAAFRGEVDVIGDIWRSLRALLAAPINFFIGTVYNDGIVRAWNIVAGLLGIGQLQPAPLIPAFATGGRVTGPGSGTSDDVLMWGSNGEHMVTAREVAGAGGHAAVAQVRSMWAAGVPVASELPSYAEGGPVWAHLRDTVLGQFPGARMTSGVRPGDPGFHGQGKAADFAGPRPGDTGTMGRINSWIAQNFPMASELIYTPGINLKNGKRHTYSAAVRNDHLDHVHWAMAAGSTIGKGGGGGFFDWIGDQIRSAVTTITDPAIGLLERTFPAPPEFARIPSTMARTVRDKALDFFLGKAEDTGSAGEPAGAGVQRWAPLVQRALGMVGQPAMLVQTTLRRMQQESGGNPRAINNWDSNARRGTPSKGLMQVIDPTFRAYRDTRAANDIWDPLANVLASMKYALGRYGSLPRAYDRAGGYDSGGVGKGIGWMWKGTGLDERVLPPQETQAYPTLTVLARELESGRLTYPSTVAAAEQYATSAARGGDGAKSGEQHLHFHEVPWTPERMLDEADRRKRFRARTR